MPHHVVSPLLSQIGLGDNFSASPHAVTPTVLTAIKEAGRSLVASVRRRQARSILSAMMVAGAALVAPHSAHAQVLCWADQDGNEICWGDPNITPRSLGPSSDPRGDPVDVASGNVFLHIVDYTTPGPNRLQMIRYYNSMPEQVLAFSPSYSFAPSAGADFAAPSYALMPLQGYQLVPSPTNWRTNYDAYLIFTPASSPTTVTADRSNGQQITFTWSGNAWVPPTDEDYTLTQSGSTWILTDHSDTKESYTNTGTGFAQLNTITYRNGYRQTLSYSGTTPAFLCCTFIGGQTYPISIGPAVLKSVTDSYGLSLSFSYNANHLLSSVSTPDGLVISYGYTYYGQFAYGSSDAGYLLTSVSYNTSPVTSQTYAYSVTALFPYELLSVTDENGNTAASWTYDGGTQAVSSQQGGVANFTSFSSGGGAGSEYTVVCNANNVCDNYAFTPLQGTLKVTEIDRAATSTTVAATETFGYDGNGYINSGTDWDGNQTSWVNDSHGDPLTINEAVGTPVARTTTISYDTTWVHEPHQIVTPGLTSTFTYDGSGNALTRTDLDATTTTTPYSTNGQARLTKWTWSSTGQEKSVQLPRTDVTAKTTFGYGSKGTLSSITDALGHETQITNHTGGGLPVTIVDPNGVTTTLAYDKRLNLHTRTLSTAAGELVTTWTHDPANNLTAVELPDKSEMKFGYDTANRLTSINDRFNHSINYTLDALGDRTLVQVENASDTVTRQHSATFDALGRMLTNVGGMGQTTAYTYDPNGNALTVTPPSPDNAPSTVTLSYDALNRVSTRVDPSPGGTTTASYDAHNRVLSVKDAYGHTTSYVYDGFGDRTEKISPDTGTATYTYDPDSNLTQIVMGGPRTAAMTYDALDRPLATTYPSDTTLNVSRTYDQAGHGFGVDRLTSATDQVGTLSLTYDERGNITNQSRVVTGAGTLNTVATYDAASRVLGIGYPSGTAVAYVRDSMGRVTSVTAQPPGASTASNVVTGLTYEPFGPETGLSFGNGIIGAYGYDLDYRPTKRTDTGASTVQKLTYAYEPNDSIKSITDAVNAANTQTLKYDALDRLTSAVSGTGGYGTQSFSWDILGNITKQVESGTTTTYSRVAGTDRLSQWATGSTTDTVGYNSTGNIETITSASTTLDNLTYNQANELASAKTPSTSATYKYDFGGFRLEKALSGSYPILYQYNPVDGTLLSENDLHKGTTADYIYLNGRPIGEVNPTTGKLYFTHTDRVGTPQKLTDPTQAVAWSDLYQPFGGTGTTVTGTLTTQSLRMPGQEFDAETGLYHNGFRDYAPSLTRYVESDPIGLAGGLNTYQYVTANPFKYADRLGLDPCSHGSVLCGSGPDGGCGDLCQFINQNNDDDGGDGPDIGGGGNPTTPIPNCASGSVLCTGDGGPGFVPQTPCPILGSCDFGGGGPGGSPNGGPEGGGDPIVQATQAIDSLGDAQTFAHAIGAVGDMPELGYASVFGHFTDFMQNPTRENLDALKESAADVVNPFFAIYHLGRKVFSIPKAY